MLLLTCLSRLERKQSSVLCASLFLFLGAVLLLPAAAWAQPIPGNVQPGVIDRQFDVRPEPQAAEPIVIPRPAEQLPPDAAADISFNLGAVELGGNTVFSTEELAQYYRDFVGTEITLSTVFAVANAISAHYADAGYALSLAYVPAQEIGDDGRVRLVVVEGYIGNIRYTGQSDAVTERLRELLAPLQQEQPLTVATMERILLLASREPGFGVAASIDRAALDVGALTLLVDIERKAISGRTGMNNRGSRALGPLMVDGLVEFNDLSSHGERLSLNLVNAPVDRELSYLGAELALPLNRNGSQVLMGYSRSDAEPGIKTLNVLDFNTDSDTAYLEVSHPFLLSRARNFNVALRLEARDSTGEFLGVENREEKIRALRLRTQYDWLGEDGGVSLLQATVSRGIDGLGASSFDNPLKGRDIAAYDASKVDAQFFRLSPLGRVYSLFLSAQLQYASDALVASEQCGLGGSSFGRAFDSFELAGDHCVLASAELRRQFIRPATGIDELYLYGFVDSGKTWTKQAANQDDLEAIGSSAGLGVRATLWREWNAYVELAKPLNREVEQWGSRKPRVYAGLRMSF